MREHRATLGDPSSATSDVVTNTLPTSFPAAIDDLSIIVRQDERYSLS